MTDTQIEFDATRDIKSACDDFEQRISRLESDQANIIAKIESNFESLKITIKRDFIIQELINVNNEACVDYKLNRHYYDEVDYIRRINNLLDELEELGLQQPFPELFYVRGFGNTVPVRIDKRDLFFN